MSRWRPVAGTLVGLVAATALAFVAPRTVRAQATGVLRVRVLIGAADGGTALGRRHALLVSDDPPSRAPWRVVTALDGTGKVTLPPGTYVVESEEPLVAQGRTYEWRQTVQVAAGGDTTLELTADNADVGTAPPSTATPGTPVKTDPWDLLVQWQDSVVALWTPMAHASGVVIAPAGLVATTHRAVGSATDIEVQVSATLKVAARVLAADPVRDVAILWIDPAAIAARRPLPLGCDTPGQKVERGQPLSAIATPVLRQPTTTRGTVFRLGPAALAADFGALLDSAGGPVFAADGALVGLASLQAETGRDDDPLVSVVRTATVCEVVAAASATMTGAPPGGQPLPVEPAHVVTEDVLRNAAKRRSGSLAPPRVSSSSFDIDFITPEVAFADQQQTMDFGQWAGYVANHLPVLLVRATPRQVESLWLKVARGAAMTQGIALPPITHYEPGFARMRVLCGSRAITPIHPFVVERRVSESAAIREGLFVLAPDAIGPHCGTVTLEVSSEKSPDKRESATVAAPILERLWQDLAPYRSTPAAR